ncbi:MULTISPECIES: extracellular matrix regulator RemB [Bacillaceae]|uniref:extracellular matrix regulator RemB n=1 Tax=Bacillaceae TaxID=186817 RepID=UPI001BDE4F79|nr:MULTISPECIES: extracellular matrix/biofilm biosynthesis regulator RemA family protein [Bacillaceae]MDX8363274.1 DUF370 domain-containing protein [Cytobacillus sp. IB215316]
MFIHLGEDLIIRNSDIIAILDRQLLTSSPIIVEFIKAHKSDTVQLSGETKSVVVTVDKVYFSPLSSNTLKKRAQMGSELDSILF